MKNLFKRIISHPILRSQTVVQATVIITVLNFLSKFIGYAREVLLAKYFGASGVLDAYLVGAQIPSMVLGLFAGGFGTLIIPTYIERRKKDKADAVRYVNQIFKVWTGIFIIISILVVIFAPYLIRIVAYGFKEDRFYLAVKITRYLSLYGLLNILMSLFIGILQSESQFLLPTITAITGNIITLLSVIFLTNRFGIYSLVIGSTLMVLYNFIILFTVLYKKYNFFHLIATKVNWIEIREFAQLLVPLIISSGVGTLNTIADRTIASNLPSGSIASMNFASRIWSIPIALIAGSLATTIFPNFSVKASDENKLFDLKITINKSIIFMIYFILPISILFITMSEPIVRLFFERGAFDAAATTNTAYINQMYSIGLVAFATYPILVKVFYAFKNTYLPLFISLGTVTLNFIGNVVLSKYMGPAGIALATSIASITGYIVAYFALSRYFKKSQKETKSSNNDLIVEFIKVLICSIIIGVLSYVCLPFLNTPAGFIKSALKIGSVGLVLAIIYVFLSSIIKTEGFKLFKPYLNKFPIIKNWF